MRAVYLEQLELAEAKEIKLTGETHHHLVRVVRLKEDDEVLILNGRGLRAKACVQEIAKKEIVLTIREVQIAETKDESRLDLVIGVPKREALEDILRCSVEMGVRVIYLFHSEFSQRFEIREDRMKKILVSALEQSNNPFIPELCVVDNREELVGKLAKYSWRVFFSTMSERGKQQGLEAQGQGVYFIGPEGGFSSSEEEWLATFATPCRLDLPIMRAPTATCVAMGYLLGLRS